MGVGGEVRQVKLYSRLACAQKPQKCKFVPRLLSMIVGQLVMFQKFEQTMVNLIFDTVDLYYGMKLMRDLRF